MSRSKTRTRTLPLGGLSPEHGAPASPSEEASFSNEPSCGGGVANRQKAKWTMGQTSLKITYASVEQVILA